MLTEIFVASIGRVPKGVCLTTMVPTSDVERTCFELRVSLADSGTTVVVVDGSVEVLRALGSRSKANALVQLFIVSGCNCRCACVGVGSRGRQVVPWIWKANNGANRGRCSVDATLAVEETFPTRGLRHEVDVFHRCDTTEASKDPHQLCRCCRLQVLMHERFVYLLTN